MESRDLKEPKMFGDGFEETYINGYISAYIHQ